MARILPGSEQLTDALSDADAKAEAKMVAEGNTIALDVYRVQEHQRAIKELLPPDWEVRVKLGSRGLEYIITPAKVRR